MILAAASLAHSSLWWVGPLALCAIVFFPPIIAISIARTGRKAAMLSNRYTIEEE